MLIDTHCHLDFKQFEQDRRQVIESAYSSGITHIVNVGSEIRGSEESIRLSEEYKNIYAAVGIHPHHAEETGKDDIRYIESLSHNDKVVAVGEVGLDYFNRESSDGSIPASLKKKQQDVLISFIDLAFRRSLPLIFHCRNAAADFMGLTSGLIKEDCGVIHCFSENKEFLRFCLDKGLFVSFTGNITYKNASDLRELIEYCPLDRMFVETDAPYLAPQSMRGKRNEPAYVRFVAEEVARIKKIDVEQVAVITTTGAKKFFGID